MPTATARATSRISGVGLGPAPPAAEAGDERTSTATAVAGMTLRGSMGGSLAGAGCRMLGATLVSAFGRLDVRHVHLARLTAAAPDEALGVPGRAAADVLPAGRLQRRDERADADRQLGGRRLRLAHERPADRWRVADRPPLAGARRAGHGAEARLAVAGLPGDLAGPQRLRVLGPRRRARE